MSPNQDCRVHALFRLAISGLLLIASAAVAGPAFYTGFEDYDGSPDGVPVAGQQGWYIPNVAGAVDQFIFTYDGNALGVPANPFGEAQFFGGQTPGIGMFPRGQLNFDWSQATVWTVSYDFTIGFNGTLPATDNISSFSLQDSVSQRYFIAVNTWVIPDTADSWNALYIVFDSTGSMIDPIGLSPGAAWRNLGVGHWYNQSTTFDFDSNTILSVSITDLDSGDTSTFVPQGWYLAGGTRPLPLPTALRYFVGGGNDMDGSPGNVGAFDNLTITAVSGAGIPNNPSGSSNAQVGRAKSGGPTTN